MEISEITPARVPEPAAEQLPKEEQPLPEEKPTVTDPSIGENIDTFA